MGCSSQPCRGSLSCLTKKSRPLECFAVLNRRFFLRGVSGDCRNTICISKSTDAPLGKKIHSKPCKSLCEAALWQRPVLFKSLPLLREVDSPKAKTEGEKNDLSPSLFASQKSSPLVTSARRRCASEQPPKAALSESQRGPLFIVYPFNA